MLKRLDLFSAKKVIPGTYEILVYALKEEPKIDSSLLNLKDIDYTKFEYHVGDKI